MIGMRGSRSCTIAVALAALLAVASPWPAAGAETEPVPPRVRADAARGAAAAARCTTQVWSTEDYASCIDGLVATAMSTGEAAAPFQLGVYCAAFYTEAHAYEVWRRKRGSGPAVYADGGLLRETALDEYDSCLYQAERLKLSPPQICTATGIACAELTPMLDRWQSTTRADE